MLCGVNRKTFFSIPCVYLFNVHLSILCFSIMVLDAGRIKEFDPPNELLSNKNSVFFSMAKDAGLVN